MLVIEKVPAFKMLGASRNESNGNPAEDVLPSASGASETPKMELNRSSKAVPSRTAQAKSLHSTNASIKPIDHRYEVMAGLTGFRPPQPIRISWGFFNTNGVIKSSHGRSCFTCCFPSAPSCYLWPSPLAHLLDRRVGLFIRISAFCSLNSIALD